MAGLANFLMNSTQSLPLRRAIAQALAGETHSIDPSCGYPGYGEITFEDYKRLYDRDGVAKRVIRVYPEECWKSSPILVETEDVDITDLEQAWSDLLTQKGLHLLPNLLRVDRLSRIGEFGILYLGFDDGKSPETEVDQAKDRKLIYLKPYSEESVTIERKETDVRNSRYGLPVLYKLRVSEGGEKLLHWTRVLHLADDVDEDPNKGSPALQCVYNRLLDIRKVLGGSAEMFWKGGFPGYLFSADPEVEISGAALEDMKDELENWRHSLTREIQLQGVTATSLAPQVSSPKEHLEAQFKFISASTGIPLRILFGSEQAQLASIQDRRNWLDRIQARREIYCGPMVVKPLVDRLIQFGVLPESKEDRFDIEWTEEDILTEKEKAEADELRAKALVEYGNSPGAQMILLPDQFLRRLMRMDAAEVEVLMEDMEEMIREEEEDQVALEESETAEKAAEEARLLSEGNV